MEVENKDNNKNVSDDIKMVQVTEMDANEVKAINEGSAKILGEGNVFYNPVQEFNRDLSICVLSTFSALWQNEKWNVDNKKKDIENSHIELKAGLKTDASIF